MTVSAIGIVGIGSRAGNTNRSMTSDRTDRTGRTGRTGRNREAEQRIRAERGKAFGAWLRAAMVNPLTGERISNLELARLTGLQSSYIDVLVNDCHDRYVDRYKIPLEGTIDAIAAKLAADANAGRRAAGKPPVDSAAIAAITTTYRPEIEYARPDDIAPVVERLSGLDAARFEIAERTVDALYRQMLRERSGGVHGGVYGASENRYPQGAAESDRELVRAVDLSQARNEYGPPTPADGDLEVIADVIEGESAGSSLVGRHIARVVQDPDLRTEVAELIGPEESAPDSAAPLLHPGHANHANHVKRG